MKVIFTNEYNENLVKANGCISSIICGYAMVNDTNGWLKNQYDKSALAEVTKDILLANVKLVTNERKTNANVLDNLFDTVYVPSLEARTANKLCSVCGGTGYVIEEEDGRSRPHICYTCNGTGRVDDSTSTGNESFGTYKLRIDSRMNSIQDSGINGVYRAIALFGQSYLFSEGTFSETNNKYLAAVIYFDNTGDHETIDGLSITDGDALTIDNTGDHETIDGLSITDGDALTIDIQVGLVEKDEPESTALNVDESYTEFIKDVYAKDAETTVFTHGSLFLTPANNEYIKQTSAYPHSEDITFMNRALTILPDSQKPFNLFNPNAVVNIWDDNKGKTVTPQLLLSYWGNIPNDKLLQHSSVGLEYTPSYFSLNGKGPCYKTELQDTERLFMKKDSKQSSVKTEIFCTYNNGDTYYNTSAMSATNSYFRMNSVGTTFVDESQIYNVSSCYQDVFELNSNHNKFTNSNNVYGTNAVKQSSYTFIDSDKNSIDIYYHGGVSGLVDASQRDSFDTFMLNSISCTAHGVSGGNFIAANNTSLKGRYLTCLGTNLCNTWDTTNNTFIGANTYSFNTGEQNAISIGFSDIRNYQSDRVLIGSHVEEPGEDHTVFAVGTGYNHIGEISPYSWYSITEFLDIGKDLQKVNSFCTGFTMGGEFEVKRAKNNMPYLKSGYSLEKSMFSPSGINYTDTLHHYVAQYRNKITWEDLNRLASSSFVRPTITKNLNTQKVDQASAAKKNNDKRKSVVTLADEANVDIADILNDINNKKRTNITYSKTGTDAIYDSIYCINTTLHDIIISGKKYYNFIETDVNITVPAMTGRKLLFVENGANGYAGIMN